MLYPLSAQIPFLAQFTTGGAGATGLTVTVSIVRLNSDGTRTTVITAASATAATELDATNAKGLYGYLLAGASTGTAGVYLATFHTTGTADLKDVPALEIVGAAWVATAAGAMQAASYTAPDNATITAISAAVDTEVAAIKAKTDLIPSDPADASDIVAAFGIVNTALGTIDDFLDTEVAAIKAKTDLIGAASVTVVSVVSADGTSIALYGGDDYHSTESREVEITDTSNSWPDLTGATVTFYAESANYGVLFTKAMTVVTPSGALKKIEIEFTAANTVTLRGQGGTGPGVSIASQYSIRAVLSSLRVVTLVKGTISVTMVADGVA